MMNSLFYTKVKKYGFWGIFICINLWQIFLGVKTDYPPSAEQIEITVYNVLIIRYVAYVLLLLSALFIDKILKLIKERNSIRKLVWLVCFTSPFIFGIWFQYPLEIFKLLITVWLIWLCLSKKLDILIAPMIIFLIIFGYYKNYDKASIFSMANMKDLGYQTDQKISSEDVISERINLPLWFRRIAYNKPSMMVRNIFKELLAFWNLEMLFYQEVSPSGQKSMIMFYWPLVIPFICGLFLITKRKGKFRYKFMGILFLMAYVDFICSNNSENRRWFLTFFLISYIIAIGFDLMLKNIYMGTFIICLWFYGWQAFNYDFGKRMDYWLNNRPLVYKFIFENNEVANTNKKVVVTDVMGNAAKYCEYYLKKRCLKNFYFSTFNLSNRTIESDEIYAGFIGEYLGSDLNNKFPDNPENIISARENKVLETKRLRDSVAYTLGDLIVIAEKK